VAGSSERCLGPLDRDRQQPDDVAGRVGVSDLVVAKPWRGVLVVDAWGTQTAVARSRRAGFVVPGTELATTVYTCTPEDIDVTYTALGMSVRQHAMEVAVRADE
jgi:hypothetical protein